MNLKLVCHSVVVGGLTAAGVMTADSLFHLSQRVDSLVRSDVIQFAVITGSVVMSLYAAGIRFPGKWQSFGGSTGITLGVSVLAHGIVNHRGGSLSRRTSVLLALGAAGGCLLARPVCKNFFK